MSVATTQADTVYQALLLMEATAGLRHDLRNRLASVRNASFYLKRKVEGSAAALWSADARVPRFFEMIDSELTAAEEIIVGTTPQALAATPAGVVIDVAALAAEVIAAHTPPAGVTIVAPEPGPHRAVASPVELHVALRCLVENAIDATGATGGTIRLTCSATDGLTRIAVVDDGAGFGDGPREPWLRPFATTKPGRLGLGLNIVRRVAARASGMLDLGAGERRGAAITISLPGPGEHEGEPHGQPPVTAGR